MLGRSFHVVVTMLLVVGGALAAAPAGADAIFRWEFDERPSGLPASDEPSQTLIAAGASLWEGRTNTFDASVRLGGVPTAETDAILRVALGSLHEGSCEETWATEVRTFAPGGLAQRDEDRIELQAELPHRSAYDDVRCGSVTLLSVTAPSVVLDLLSEPGTRGMAIADPGGTATVRTVRERWVVPGRWSTIWVEVGYRGAVADGVLLRGSGKRIAVRRTRVDLDLEHGDRIWVPLEVRLRGDRSARLTIAPQPLGSLIGHGRSRTVWLRPAR